MNFVVEFYRRRIGVKILKFVWCNNTWDRYVNSGLMKTHLFRIKFHCWISHHKYSCTKFISDMHCTHVSHTFFPMHYKFTQNCGLDMHRIYFISTRLNLYIESKSLLRGNTEILCSSQAIVLRRRGIYVFDATLELLLILWMIEFFDSKLGTRWFFSHHNRIVSVCSSVYYY